MSWVQIEQNYTPHNVTHHGCHALSFPSLEIFIFIFIQKEEEEEEEEEEEAKRSWWDSI